MTKADWKPGLSDSRPPGGLTPRTKCPPAVIQVLGATCADLWCGQGLVAQTGLAEEAVPAQTHRLGISVSEWGHRPSHGLPGPLFVPLCPSDNYSTCGSCLS